MKNIILITILIFLPVVSNAQIVGDDDILTLDDCLSIALEHNLDLLVNVEQVESSRAEKRAAFGQYLPFIGLNGGYSRQLNNLSQGIVFGDRIFSQNPNRFSLNAGANLTLFNGFIREYNYSAADDNLEAAKLNSSHLKTLVKIQVYRNFTNVVRNQQIVRIRRENLELGKKDLERIKAQFEAGVIPINNIYTQESELGNLEFELLAAENDLFSSKADLLNVMGLDPDLNVSFDINSIPSDVTDREVESFYENYSNYENVIKRALRNRYDYKANELSQNAATASLQAAEGNYYPSIRANSGWSWANQEFQEFGDRGNFSVGLSLNVPIFNNFRTDQTVQNAELQLKQVEIDKQRLEQDIRKTVKIASLKLESSQKQLRVTKKSLKSAEKNFESSKEMYKVGTGSIIEYQRANTQYITAQINRINAVYNYLLAKREMLFATGVQQ